MAFIKGAWLDPWRNIFPWDVRWHELFCCPNHALLGMAHIDKTHTPQQWITFQCELTDDKKEIPFTDERGK